MTYIIVVIIIILIISLPSVDMFRREFDR